MQVETKALVPVEINDRTCVLDGFGVKVAVRRGHLLLSDGTGRKRRESLVARPGSKLRHLVIVGHTGSVSFEALRWMADVGVNYVHMDGDGRILATSGALGLDDASLRRAQAMASTSHVGLQITRWVLAEKLLGQADLLRNHLNASDAERRIRERVSRMAECETLEDMRIAEAEAARNYWGAFSDVPLTFARKDERRVPEHWKTFGTRRSLITGNPRRATNPANAILNYLYAILESQTRIACMKVGLDPGMALLHADQPQRDSLALDLMEAVRPSMDAALLDLLEGHIFAANLFIEDRKGVCRVLAPLSHQLSAYSSVSERLIGPVAERVAQALSDGSGRPRALPTRMTERRRSAGRDATRVVPIRERATKPAGRKGCRECGTPMGSRERTVCDECLPGFRDDTTRRLSSAGPAALARLREKGLDPAKRPEVREKVGRKQRSNAVRRREWEAANPVPQDDALFREILPLLQQVSLGRMAKATGLSQGYCGRIRRGEYVPHPMYWDALETLAQSSV